MLSKKETAQCCQVLRHLLYHEDSPFPPDTDWERLSRIFQAHRMESMVTCCNDAALRPLMRPECLYENSLYRWTQRDLTDLLFREMDRRGIRGAVLKGLAIERCYPPEVMRPSGDIDLFIPGNQRPAFSALMDELHMTLLSPLDRGQQGVDVYRTESGLEFEVHYIYFHFYTARQRSILQRLGCFSERCLVPGGDSDVRYDTVRPDLHLAYLIYHSAKHMLHHDLSLRMLSDLSMFINRYGDAIDPERFRRLTAELRMTRVTDALLCFCMKHLGMRTDFWQPQGRSREHLLRLCLTSPEDYPWERSQKQVSWPFYRSSCVETADGYASVRRYRPLLALRNRSFFTTFLSWRFIRLLWGVEIDRSGKAL